MRSTPVPKFVTEGLERMGIKMSELQLATLSGYVDALLQANRHFNLTSIRNIDEVWRVHIFDSLTVLPRIGALNRDDTLIDVGSGGGLPGIPLAIARPDLHIALLEATRTKAKFLERCVRELALGNVVVVNDRAETVGQDIGFREQYDTSVCRAVGSMPVLLEFSLPLVRTGGIVLAMKGPTVDSDLEVAAQSLDVLGGGEVHKFQAYPQNFGRNTVIVSVRKIHSTPMGYPRRPGVPRRSPL